MSGLGPVLYLPWGASASWLLRAAKAEDGSAVDLTLLTAASFTLRTSPTLPDASAELTLSIANAGLVVIDALAGLVKATLTAAQSASLVPYGPFYYRTQLTFADGSVHIPDLLRGTFYNDLDRAESQACDGAAITRLDAATGTLTPLTPDMSNYLINRYDLTALAGTAATALAGLPAGTLTGLQNGAGVRLFFTGSICADFRLRANTGAETQSAPWRILALNATLRLWELIAVTKQGVPCVWNPDTVKFHQLLASGTGTAVTPALANEADAFSLPA
ncbi:MAG: hypothetical protein H7343_12260 [Undibacterium sp.]|nr:hypothetical protein [Opitutaceae bacterium]